MNLETKTCDESLVFSLFLREIYDEDTVVFYLSLRQIIQHQCHVRLKSRAKQSGPDVSKLALRWIKFTDHDLVSDGTQRVWLSTTGAAEILQTFLKSFVRSSSKARDIVQYICFDLLPEFRLLEHQSETDDDENWISVQVFLRRLIEYFANIPSDIVARFKHSDDGQFEAMFETIQQTFVEEQELVGLKVEALALTAVVRHMQVRVMQLRQQVQVRKQRESRTALVLEENALYRKEQELGHLNERIQALESRHHQVWDQVVQHKQDNIKTKKKRRKRQNVDHVWNVLLPGSCVLIYRRYIYTIQRAYDQHVMKSKTLRLLAPDKVEPKTEEMLEQFRLSQIKIIQRAFRARRARQARAQAERLAREKRKAQQKLDQQRALKLSQKNLALHRARMSSHQIRQAAVAAETTHRNQRLVKNHRLQEAQRRHERLNQRLVQRLFRQWTLFVRVRHQRARVTHDLRSRMWRHWRAFVNVKTRRIVAAKIIQKAVRRHKERREQRAIVQNQQRVMQKLQKLCGRLASFELWHVWSTWQGFLDRQEAYRRFVHRQTRRRYSMSFRHWTHFCTSEKQKRAESALVVQRSVCRYTRVWRYRRCAAARIIQCCERQRVARAEVQSRREWKAGRWDPFSHARRMRRLSQVWQPWLTRVQRRVYARGLEKEWLRIRKRGMYIRRWKKVALHFISIMFFSSIFRYYSDIIQIYSQLQIFRYSNSFRYIHTQLHLVLSAM